MTLTTLARSLLRKARFARPDPRTSGQYGSWGRQADADQAHQDRVVAAATARRAQMPQPPPAPGVVQARAKTGIAEHLRGTRLAFHLLQLRREFAGDPEMKARLDAALTDRGLPHAHAGGHTAPGASAEDNWGRIGALLQSRGHAWGSAYNWGRIGQSLAVDKMVKEYVEGRVRVADQGKVFGTVLKHFDPATGTQAAKGRSQPASAMHDDFWSGLRDHVKSRMRGVYDREHYSDAALARSLRRHAYREQDAAEIAGQVPKVGPKPTDSGKVVRPATTSGQDYLSYLPGVGSAEQYRRGTLQRYSSHDAFHEAIKVSGKDRLPSLVYADWLEEQGQHAHAEVVRRHQERAERDHQPAVSEWDSDRPPYWNPGPTGISAVAYPAGPANMTVAVGRSHQDGGTWRNSYHHVVLDPKEAHHLVSRLEREGVPGAQVGRQNIEYRHPYIPRGAPDGPREVGAPLSRRGQPQRYASHESFAQAMLAANQYDRLPSLVYADWLEEQGQHAHAEVVRHHQARAEASERKPNTNIVRRVAYFSGHMNRDRGGAGIRVHHWQTDHDGSGENSGEPHHSVAVGHYDPERQQYGFHAATLPVRDAHHLLTRLEAEGVPTAGIARQQVEERYRNHNLGGAQEHLSRRGRPVRYSHDAFHKEMLSKPTDTLPPLVYADWLEENGKPAYGSIVRHHVANTQKSSHMMHGRAATYILDRGAWGRLAGEPGPAGVPSVDHWQIHGNQHVLNVGVDHPETNKRTSHSAVLDPASAHHWAMKLADEGIAGGHEAVAGIERQYPHLNLHQNRPQPEQPEQYAAYRAPQGGMIAKGIFYPGGQTVPDVTKLAAGQTPTPKPTGFNAIIASIVRKNPAKAVPSAVGRAARQVTPNPDVPNPDVPDLDPPNPNPPNTKVTRYRPNMPPPPGTLPTAKPLPTAPRLAPVLTATPAPQPLPVAKPVLPAAPPAPRPERTADARPATPPLSMYDWAEVLHPFAKRMAKQKYGIDIPDLGHFLQPPEPPASRRPQPPPPSEPSEPPDTLFPLAIPRAGESYHQWGQDHGPVMGSVDPDRPHLSRQGRVAKLARRIVWKAAGRGQRARYSHEAFQAAIEAADEHDRLPSLVYADWLEEQGQTAHAEVVRRHQQRAEGSQSHVVPEWSHGRQLYVHHGDGPGVTVRAWPLATGNEHAVTVGMRSAAPLRGIYRRIYHQAVLPPHEAHRLLSDLEEQGVPGAANARADMGRHYEHLDLVTGERRPEFMSRRGKLARFTRRVVQTVRASRGRMHPVVASFGRAVGRQRYAADDHGMETGPVGFQVRRANGDVFPPDAPRHIVADALDDDNRPAEAHKLRTPGLIAKVPSGGSHGTVKRGRYTAEHVLGAAQNVLDHLEDWSGGQYEPPQFEVNGDSPDHVAVVHHNEHEEADAHRVHYRDLGDHLAGVIDDDLGNNDYGWNTTGIAEGDAGSMGITDEIGMIPLDHNSRRLSQLAEGGSLDHDALGRAESEARRLAEQWQDQGHSLEGHDDHDEDAARELFQNAEAAREIAFRINRHRNDMAGHQDGMGVVYDTLLKTLREAPHVEADPTDDD